LLLEDLGARRTDHRPVSASGAWTASRDLRVVGPTELHGQGRRARAVRCAMPVLAYVIYCVRSTGRPKGVMIGTTPPLNTI
jgi:hypothetical protein